MERRKNFLIKKHFQFTFLGSFIVLLAVESVLIVSLFLFLSRDTLTTGYIDSILRVERTQNFFIIPFMLLTLIIVLGFFLRWLISVALLIFAVCLVGKVTLWGIESLRKKDNPRP